MNRRPSTQDITWLLDLNRNGQLDLDPPYQRRSVWTIKDKQFFLDTIFRNYPSPAIFLHKTIDDAGKATYHVVDGKQRTQTILDFVNDKLRIGKDFGDVRLDGKKWSELGGETDLRQKVWNYQLTIEQIDFVEGKVVNEVFDRLNRNARRLTPQELRHAKFDGWFISLVEAEAGREEWAIFGVVTKARAKRMADGQFISELLLVELERRVLGFDQDALDELYGKYEVPESIPEFDEDARLEAFEQHKNYLLALENSNNAITQYAKALANFYTLWCLVVLTPDLPLKPEELAPRYTAFMQKVVELSAQQENLQAFLVEHPGQDYAHALTYLNNFTGANTDLAQRQARLEALRAGVL
jgi:hypothetical protein